MDDGVVEQIRTVVGLDDASAFLSQPTRHLKEILTNPTQRAALEALLDNVVPGASSGHRQGWHPLLWTGDPAQQPSLGNLYVVFDPVGGETQVSIAGEFHTAEGVTPKFSIDAKLPLLKTQGADLVPAIGPDDVAFEVAVNLESLSLGGDVRFDAISAALDLHFGAHPRVVPNIDISGFAIGTATPRNLTLSADSLGRDAADLLLSLLREALGSAPEPLRSHLLPALGLDPSLATLALLDLPGNPDLLRAFLLGLVDGGKLSDWFDHIAALFGVTSTSGTGVPGDPRLAKLVSGEVDLGLTLASADGRLFPGFSVRIGPTTSLHLAADLVLIGLPLRGASDVTILPEASVTVRSPSPLLAPVIEGGVTVAAAGAARAGVAVINGQVKALLELDDVTLAGQSHPQIDLTNLDAVGNLAASAIENALTTALGDGLARHLLALVGVVPPSKTTPGDVWTGGAPPRLDLIRLLSDPLGAIADFQRKALVAGGWNALLEEVATLVGVAGGVTGSGSLADPWSFPLASDAPLSVRIVAWRSDDVALNLGAAVVLEEGPFRFALTSNVVRLLAPPSGTPEVALVSEHHLDVVIAPLPSVTLTDGTGLSVDRFTLGIGWQLGHTPVPEGGLQHVVLTVDGTALPAFDVAFPFTALSIDDAALRALVQRIARRFGGPSTGPILALAGLGAPDLPADFPVLGGHLVDGVLSQLRAYAQAVATGVSSTHVPHVMSWLRLVSTLTGTTAYVTGGGIERDPWRVELFGPTGVELLVWLTPNGAAAPLTDALARASDGSDACASAAAALRPFLPTFADAFDSLDTPRLASGIDRLEAFLGDSDGVVPIASQCPDAYTRGATIAASHTKALAAGAAAIRAEIGAGVAVLISAPFDDHVGWSGVIGADASANFNLRSTIIPPEQVDLRTVTEVVPFYTADLAGTDPANLAVQIGLVVQRLSDVRPGVPLVLVAHSLSGVAAVSAAQAAPTRVSKVITIGSPHLGAAPPYVNEMTSGVALRLARVLRSQFAAGALADALDDAQSVVDHAVVRAAPIPIPSIIASAAPPAAPAVPVVTLPVNVGGGFFNTLMGALRAAAPSTPPAPTAINVGIALELDAPSNPGDLSVRSELRLDVGAIGLSNASLDAVSRKLSVTTRVERRDDWLLGGPGAEDDGTPWPARIRRATFGAVWDGDALTSNVTLVDASVAGSTAVRTLADASSGPLLDALFASIATDPAAATWMSALRKLGIVLSDTPRLASDALAALEADGAAFILPRLAAALAAATPSDSFYGLSADHGWTIGPLSVSVSGSGIRVQASEGIVAGDLNLSLSSLVLGGTAAFTTPMVSIFWSPGKLEVAADPWIPRTQIWPSPPPFGELAARIAFSAGVDGVLDAVLPIKGPWPPIDALFSGRASFASGTIPLNPAGIQFILQRISTAIGHPSPDGLLLGPANFLLAASAGTTGQTILALRTTAPLGGVVAVDFELAFGARTRVDPSGSVTLTLPDLPEAGAGAWRGVGVQLGVGASGVSLALVVGETHVPFLPTFGGWQSLLAGGLALLPHALDEITTRIPASPTKTAVLDVARALELYDPTFTAHVDQFTALTTWTFDAAHKTRLVDAAGALLGDLGLPGTFLHPPGGPLTWTSPAFPPPITGNVSLAIEWTGDFPTATITGGVDIELNHATSALEEVLVHVGLDAAVRSDFHAVVTLGLDQPLGTAVVPRLEVGVRQVATSAAPVMRLLPLAATSADGPVALELLPTVHVVTDDSALPGAIALNVLLPVLTAFLERVNGTTTLWPGGPTPNALVSASGIFDASRRLANPLPDVPTVLGNVASAMSVALTIGELRLTLGSLDAAGRIGAAASGRVPIPIDSIELDVVLGEDGSGPDVERTEVTLFARDAGRYQFAPALSANHFGVGVRGNDGAPLFSNDTVRLGGAEAFTFFDVDATGGSVEAEFRGAGVEIDDLGVSLGSGGGDNAIANGLMASTQHGDGAPAQPTFGISIEYEKPEGDDPDAGTDFELNVRLEGTDPRKQRIPIHAAFGPLHIDQIDIELEKVTNPAWIKVGIDGGVDVSGFSAEVDDLSLQVPLPNVTDLSNWHVDLDGLAISYDNGSVSVLGGLLKQTITGGVEYSGMLRIRAEGIGAVAIGSWAKVDDTDSLFIFAAVFVTITFAPYFQLQALGGGFGYNRALLVPDQVTGVPSFPLVAVLDDPGSVDHPLVLLQQLETDMPVRRGSFWFAAGIRGAIFTVVEVVAVVYVALDRNFEIGILGVGRLAQPEGAPIVSIELAIKVRFSTADGILSMQAQLTDNSWLLVSDCQLTGGFALFIWFRQGKFVLTMGGYHPAFNPPPEFPVVPRLGFRFTLADVIQIKGGSYFALTNSCVMAGASLEASYDIGWLRAWFKAWADFLLSWDPFHYDVSVGIELGADFHIDIDLLFGTITVSFSVSVGADLRLVGPPMHGEVEANLGPISITVPFGSDEPPVPDPLPWEIFRDRYILGGDPTTIPVSAQPDEGLVPPPSGSKPPEGKTPDDPLRLVAEFTFLTTTAVPSSHVTALGILDGAVADVDVDFAPMGAASVGTTHRVSITNRDGSPVALDPAEWQIDQTLGDFAEAVWRIHSKPPAAAENIKGLSGLTIHAVAAAINPSADIPIGTLTDTGPPLPLPFASQDAVWRAGTVRVGQAASAFAATWSMDAVALLSKGSPAHEGLPIRAPGIDGVAMRSLKRRTTPPLFASLAEGMDLGSPNRGVISVPLVPPVVVQQRPPSLVQATYFAPGPVAPKIATTARNAGTLQRTAPPMPKGPIGRLVTVPTSVPETKAAMRAPSAPGGPLARKVLDATSATAVRKGVELAAGAVQTWSVPSPGSWRVALAGDVARLVILGRGGYALVDIESSGEQAFDVPAGAVSITVWSLGRVGTSVAPGPAAFTSVFSSKSPVAVGWHAESILHVVDPRAALGCGSRLRLSAAAKTQGLVRASALLAGQTTVETTLPGSVQSLLLVGALTDPTAALEGDLDLAADGATLGTPLLFESESEHAALYAVTEAAPTFRVAVASTSGYRLSGVIGLRGKPVELAARLHGSPLVDLVSDGPISLNGSVHLAFTRGTL